MSPSRIAVEREVSSTCATAGIRVARWIGIEQACDSVSPSAVNRLADASSPSLTMGEKELRSSVDCISLAMPSSLLRTTSTVIGSRDSVFAWDVIARSLSRR